MVPHIRHPPRSNAMTSFLHRLGAAGLGVLSGFDRLRLRGALPRPAHTGGLSRWLEAARVPLKDFPAYAEGRTQQLRQAIEAKAEEAGRPVEYLAGYTDKEALVRRRLESDGAAPGGLVCAFSTPENCTSYDVYRDPKAHTIELRRRPRQCRHSYVYSLDRRFGLAQVRLQTWFPFDAHVVLNGREWLARDLERCGIGYRRRDNCFTGIEDFARAQRLADRQVGI